MTDSRHYNELAGGRVYRFCPHRFVCPLQDAQLQPLGWQLREYHGNRACIAAETAVLCYVENPNNAARGDDRHARVMTATHACRPLLPCAVRRYTSRDIKRVHGVDERIAGKQQLPRATPAAALQSPGTSPLALCTALSRFSTLAPSFALHSRRLPAGNWLLCSLPGACKLGRWFGSGVGRGRQRQRRVHCLIAVHATHLVLARVETAMCLPLTAPNGSHVLLCPDCCYQRGVSCSEPTLPAFCALARVHHNLPAACCDGLSPNAPCP